MASLDERGRFLAPAWLRQRGGDVLVGVDRDGATVLIAPVEARALGLDLADIIAAAERQQSSIRSLAAAKFRPAPS